MYATYYVYNIIYITSFTDNKCSIFQSEPAGSKALQYTFLSVFELEIYNEDGNVGCVIKIYLQSSERFRPNSGRSILGWLKYFTFCYSVFIRTLADPAHFVAHKKLQLLNKYYNCSTPFVCLENSI